jgi:hypothetical protein
VFAQGGDRRRQAIALSNQAAALDSLETWGRHWNCIKSAPGVQRAGEEEMLAMVLQNISTSTAHRQTLQAVATMSFSS